MDDEMIKRCKFELMTCFAPAIDFKAPYAKIMADMAIKKIIKAMREPTEKQLITAFNKIQISTSHAEVIYKVMIDSILND